MLTSVVPTATLTAPRPHLDVLGVPGQINLDYAATAPCARAAADAVAALLPWYGSVHRGAGALSRRCTLAYESARQSIGDFVGARAGDHVIFTRNTTDALNLLASAVPPGTIVVTYGGEHHANLLPWPGNTIRLPVPASPGAAVRDLGAALGELRRGGDPGRDGDPRRGGGPVLVTVTGASNVTGERWPIAELARTARRHGARIAVDAAQLAPHAPVDIADLGVDYLALSGHKLYAPFGAGVLVGRGDWLDAAAPYLAGGGATTHVGAATHDVRWADGPARHEAGTPNLLGAVALAAVCDALAAADRGAVHAREQELLARLRHGLRRIDGVVELRMFGAERRAGRHRLVRGRRPGLRRGGCRPRHRARHRGAGRPVLRPPAGAPADRRGGGALGSARPAADRAARQHRPGHDGRARRPAPRGIGDNDGVTTWHEAVRGAGATAPDSAIEATGADLQARWSEPHRRYHNADHLAVVLSHVDLLAARADDPDVVRLAAWYHDAVYDPRGADNEGASAELAVTDLGRLGLPATNVAEVRRLVLLTAGHAATADDRNGAVLCDADLAILASEPAAYDAYAVRVREEYAHVPDELFRVGRATVLRQLLDLPALYRLMPSWEPRARANLERELAGLT